MHAVDAITARYPALMIRSKKNRPQEAVLLYGGGPGIRTPGTSRFNGFQDRRFRPLSQPTEARIIAASSRVASLSLDHLFGAKKTALGAVFSCVTG